MGYITQFTLSILSKNGKPKKDDSTDELITELREVSEGAAYALNEFGDVSDSCKWYEHEEDMRAFSKKHPEELFKLEGVGEASPDIWVHYFKNGKAQLCQGKITFDAYDETKLK